MQNNYVKELATKTYQEELAREYFKGHKRPFHPPSFISGIVVSVLVIGLISPW